MKKILLAAATLCLAMGFLPPVVKAQQFPSKEIRIVVPFLPGAGNDLLGRLTAEALTRRLKQTVFVENKPGAGSQIGIELIARAAPDGYNLLWSASDGISILPAVRKTVPYKVPDDFAFIARIVQLPFMVAVRPDLPVKTMQEFIDYAKANPGKIRYGTSGIGGAPHLGSLLIEKSTGIRMVHSPYSGVSAAVTDLIGGHIDMALVTPQTIRSYAESGAVRLLATTGTERHPLFPDVPTLEEAGLKGVSMVVWYGILAPVKTPEAVQATLREALADVLKDPSFVEHLNSLGYQPSYLGGDAFKAFVVDDLNKWRAVAADAHISIE